MAKLLQELSENSKLDSLPYPAFQIVFDKIGEPLILLVKEAP